MPVVFEQAAEVSGEVGTHLKAPFPSHSHRSVQLILRYASPGLKAFPSYMQGTAAARHRKSVKATKRKSVFIPLSAVFSSSGSAESSFLIVPLLCSADRSTLTPLVLSSPCATRRYSSVLFRPATWITKVDSSQATIFLETPMELHGPLLEKLYCASKGLPDG